MLKKLLLLGMLLSTSNAYALDELSAIPTNHEKILSSIQTTFKIKKLSSETKLAIYNKFSWALEGKWSSWWVGNHDLSGSKFKNNPVQIYELIIANNDRTNIISFTYFPKVQQIFYSIKEFVETDSSDALKLFKKEKNKETTKVIGEGNHFGFTRKKGYMNFVIHHIDAPNAGISYIRYGIIDVK